MWEKLIPSIWFYSIKNLKETEFRRAQGSQHVVRSKTVLLSHWYKLAQDFSEKNTAKGGKDKKDCKENILKALPVSMFFLILPVQFLLTDLISSKSISASHQLLDFFHGDNLAFFIPTGFSPSCPSVELQHNTTSLQIHRSKDLFSEAKKSGPKSSFLHVPLHNSR